MPDKDVMALIKKTEDERSWRVLDKLAAAVGGDDVSAPALRASLAILAEDWRATADLYDKAKLKGATTTYVVPLRHAAAELDKVVKALERPRDAPSGPRQRTQQCLDQSPHERHENGTGLVTGDPLICIGVPPIRDLTSLDALIADAKAEGRGTVRDLPVPDFPGQATDTEVIDYLKGARNDIPGTSPLGPSGVRSMAELAAEAGAEIKAIADARGALASAEEIAAAGLVLDPNGSEHGPDDRNYSRIPSTWETSTMTADGLRPPGIPPTPLLGQPGDAGAGYDLAYIPPGGVPFSYAELLMPVPLAILPPHLSHSQIGTIGECPVKYRAQRLGRTSDANGAPFHEPIHEIPQWALTGGRAFHAFVEAWERAIAAGGVTHLAPFTAEDARTAWETYFGREIEQLESTSPVPRSRWRGSKQGAEGETWWNANGPLMLSRYVAARAADERTWAMPGDTLGVSDLALELERTVGVPGPYGDLPYRAIIDRIRVQQAEGEQWITLVIDDYKTGDKMPLDTSQLGEYAQVLRLLGVPPQVKILGRFFNARKGTWTAPVDLEAEGWTAEWFSYHVASGHAGRLALTTGPTPARPSSFCGGCSVRWACPIKGPKR